MPWCPKCKSEYRENYVVCADCGSKLVDDEQFMRMEEGAPSSEQLLNPHTDDNGQRDFDTDGLRQGNKDAGDILQNTDTEAGVAQKSGDTDEQRGEAAASAQGHVATEPVYQDSSERASENRSSAWVLMLVGGVGILVLGLGITGIIPLHFGNAYLFYGVMAAVFILFLVAGIVSMKNAVFFERKAESENSVRDTMLKWCRENLTAEGIDGQIEQGGDETEEALYFKRFEYIRAKLNYQFVNLDQGFLDKFIDDCVYDTIFGKDEEEA